MIDQGVIWGSWIPSVIGGVLAGLIVIMMELLWRWMYGWILRRRAVATLRKFFAGWEKQITSATAIEWSIGDQSTEEVMKFIYHRFWLQAATFRVATMTGRLNDDQARQVSNLIANEEAKVERIPEGSVPCQSLYDQFFNSVKEVKWLKYR